jgi:Thioesterase-like superfamily
MHDAVSPVRHLYETHGSVFHPTPLVRGPWNPEHQGGMQLAGLLAHLIETAPAPAPMLVARVTVDILRPTPVKPLEAHVRVVRDGRKVQMLEASLCADRVVTVRASALRSRTAESPHTAGMDSPDDPPEAPPFLSARSQLARIADTRLVSGGLEHQGPGSMWCAFDGEIVRGAPITPFVQAMMVADMGSGLSSFVDWRAWSFANLDVTLHLLRMPEGAWLKLDAASLSAGNGIAVVSGQIADRRGTVGRTQQTLFLEPRQRRLPAQ